MTLSKTAKVVSVLILHCLLAISPAKYSVKNIMQTHASSAEILNLKIS